VTSLPQGMSTDAQVAFYSGLLKPERRVELR
jgi:hypothetical protein